MDNQNDIELNLTELYFYIRKRIWIIILSFVICAVTGFAYTKLFTTPQYTASTRMYILNRTYENAVVYADLQTSSYLLRDYEILITGQNVTMEVIEQMDLSLTPTQLAAKITVTAPENTRILQIDITDADPQLAADIANTVREVASTQIKDLMDVDAVKLVYAAEVPTDPASGVLRNTVLAAGLGLAASLGLLIVIFFLDDTIRTEEDVERYLGLSTMGVIPATMDLSNESAKAVPRKKREV